MKIILRTERDSDNVPGGSDVEFSADTNYIYVKLELNERKLVFGKEDFKKLLTFMTEDT